MDYALYALHRGDNTEPRRLAECARRTEAAGFESLWVGDHIALPADAPDSATEPRLEALTALTYLAAVTERVRLGVGVLVLPQRQPVLLAKQLTSIDVLSGGRLVVGVGVGYVRAELGAFGVELADRAARTDEPLDVLRALGRHEQPPAGRFVPFDGVVQPPAPPQRPPPPIVVGGHVRPALERAARVGDGWFGWDLTPDDLVPVLDRLHGARERLGGPRPEVTVTPPDPVLTPGIAARHAPPRVDPPVAGAAGVTAP